MSAHLMTHLKCPHCDRKFSGPRNSRFTMPRLKGSLANHIKGSHPEHYIPSEAAKKRALEKLHVEVQSASDDPHRSREALMDELETTGNSAFVKAKTKRPYVRRPAVNAVQTVEVKFCPECGCNLRIISEAIKMGRGQ